MKLLTVIAEAYFPALTQRRMTLEEIIARDIELCVKESENAAHVVRLHSFQKFIADKRIEALKAWTDAERPPESHPLAHQSV